MMENKRLSLKQGTALKEEGLWKDYGRIIEGFRRIIEGFRRI
jgi:hypothetical protein